MKRKSQFLFRRATRFAAVLGAITGYAQVMATVPDPAEPFSLRPDQTLTIPLPHTSARPIKSAMQLPLSFVRNDGQAEAATKFQLHGRGYLLSLEQTEMVMVLTGRSDEAQSVGDTASEFHLLRTKLVGAQSGAAITGEDELPGKFNFFIGNNPAHWRTNVPTFTKVRYREVYPGIDLVYYGKEGQLEYDFVIAPGADPARIELAVEGADTVEVDGNGDLHLAVAGRELCWRKPVLFQEVDGVRIPVAGEYVLLPAHGDSEASTARRVAFRVAPYDRALALVIDPLLNYSTYLGGGLNDQALAVAVDPEGIAYVTGFTWSGSGYIDFPTTTNSIMRTFTVNGAAFVTKFNPAGNAILYSTVLTGTSDPFGESFGSAIAVDATGSAVVFGRTDLDDFPIANAPQSQFGGGGDAFVAKLSPDGAALVFSTFLGGSSSELPGGIALDSASNIYVTGSTRSADFPTVSAVQPDFGGDPDAFISMIAADGTQFVYSTFLGGSGDETSPRIAVDPSGHAYVAGASSELFLLRFSTNGSGVDFSKSNFLGGDATISGMALDSTGSVFLTGSSGSQLATTPKAFQSSFGGGYVDGFVAKYVPATGTLDYLTYLGGADSETVNAIAVDQDGNAYVAGGTASTNFPMVDPIQGVLKGQKDAFVSKLNADGSKVVWSSYFGGTPSSNGVDGIDEAYGIALDSTGSVYVAGRTSSRDFPVQNAYQKTLKVLVPWYPVDAFVLKLNEPPPPSIQIARTGSSVTISWPVAATGFHLEVSNSLTLAPNWIPEPSMPAIVGGQKVVTIEIGGGSKFFRLKKP